MKMKGRAPLGIRTWICVQTFLAISVLVFGALTVIFLADYVMEFRDNLERFFWRVTSYAVLSLFFGFLAAMYHAGRTHRWRIADGALHLDHWGELSGAHHAVTFRVYRRNDDEAQLKAILDSGHDAVLARGTCQDMLKICHYAKEALRHRRG